MNMIKNLSLYSLDKETSKLSISLNQSIESVSKIKSDLTSAIASKGVEIKNDPDRAFKDFGIYINELEAVTYSQSAPSMPPKIVEVTEDSITVRVQNTGAKIRFGSQVVSSPYTFKGLKEDTNYTFYAFYPAKPSEFLGESPNSSPVTVRTLIGTVAAKVPGNKKPLRTGTTTGTNYGTSTHAYYGKVQGLITGNELISKAGVTQGTTRISGDITWLKFEHNGKVLFVANDHIKNGISWDHLEEKRVVRGKVIDIDGTKYLLRLLHGSTINPDANTRGEYPRPGSEWDDLIVKYTPGNSDSNWSGIRSWCQESGESKPYRVRRGNDSVAYFTTNNSDSASSYNGWRPVLEVL